MRQLNFTKGDHLAVLFKTGLVRLDPFRALQDTEDFFKLAAALGLADGLKQAASGLMILASQGSDNATDKFSLVARENTLGREGIAFLGSAIVAYPAIFFCIRAVAEVRDQRSHATGGRSGKSRNGLDLFTTFLALREIGSLPVTIALRDFTIGCPDRTTVNGELFQRAFKDLAVEGGEGPGDFVDGLRLTRQSVENFL